MMVPVQCRERGAVIIIIGKGYARDQHPKSPLTLVLVLVHRTHLSHQYVYNTRVKISSIVDMFPSCRLFTTALILILYVYSPATTGTVTPRVSQKVEIENPGQRKEKVRGASNASTFFPCSSLPSIGSSCVSSSGTPPRSLQTRLSGL